MSSSLADADELTQRLCTLREALEQVRVRISEVQDACSRLHSIDGKIIGLDVLMLGSTIAGGLTVMDVGMKTHTVLLDRCIATRAVVVGSETPGPVGTQN